jgi:hypothetical protein
MCPFAARPSRIIVLCSWKMKQLLDRVDNRRPTRGSQNDALEWVRRMLHGFYILLLSCVDSHLALLHFSL